MDALMQKLARLGSAPRSEFSVEQKPVALRRMGVARQYQAAQHDRLTSGWHGSFSSADIEIEQGLRTMVARSRSLGRDSSYTKRAKAIVVNNVIGTHIGLQAQIYTSRGDLNRRLNDDIEEAHCIWCRADSCHTGGRLSLAAMERQAMGQVFEAGEVFIRQHYRAFGQSRIPYALELIEAERVPIDVRFPMVSANTRMGVEVDEFHRPVAYWIRQRHPGEYRHGIDTPERIERVPASEIIHLAILDRWPQTRGVPWLHTAARRLNDMDGYSEAEIVRARGQAVRMGIIETPEESADLGEEQEDGSVIVDLEPGLVGRLNPGEKWHDSSPTAPNPQLDPFMRYMLREVAAGIGISYESLSRDYSQSNYSSSRLALLDDRDTWRVLQSWFIESFRAIVYRSWLQQAVLARAISSIGVGEYAANREKFESVRFRPRGWGWVDPTKEVAAFTNAVRSGFMTLQDVISTSGADFEEVLNQRKKEVQMIEAAGLILDTDPKQVSATGLTQARPVGTTIPLPQEEAVALKNKPPDEGGGDEEDESETPLRRGSSFLRPVK